MRSKTGLALHTATVAFAPSRALTSHLRRRFERCYLGVCRFPRLTFLFDAVLAVLAVALAVTSIWFAVQPIPQSGVTLSLVAPPLSAGASVPLSVHVRSADGQPHYNVQLRLHLPPGSQLVNVQPPLSAQGVLLLGDLKSGEELTSRIIVKLFQAQGGKADFGFTVSYTDEKGRAQFYGVEQRDIVSSQLIAEVPPEFYADAVVRDGAIIPIRVQNTSNDTLPVVHLQIHESASHAEERITLGDLAPGESRWIYLALRAGHGDASLDWSVGSASRDLSISSWRARSVVSASDSPVLPDEPVSRRAVPTNITITGVGEGQTLLVVHPQLDPAVRSIALPTGPSASVTLSAPTLPSGPNHEWLIATRTLLPDGTRVLGSAQRGVIEAAGFPLTATVRYTSSAGDQLGLGPHPPRVGEETRYWVFWQVGPVDSALRDIQIETELPPGVQTTGNVSVADGGTFSVMGRHIQWSLPQLGGEGASREAVFGFEIRTTPQAGAVGAPLQVLATSTGRAVDTHTAARFQAADGPKTTAF